MNDCGPHFGIVARVQNCRRIFSFDRVIIFGVHKKYLVQKIRTRQSALYIDTLLENLPVTYEYSYTRDRRTRHVAHHSRILWVGATAVSITACVPRSLAETRPLYSRRRPCRRKVSCTCYISKSVRCYENSQYTRHLVRRNPDTRARGTPKASHARTDLWFTSWHLFWSFWCLTACVQQMVRR